MKSAMSASVRSINDMFRNFSKEQLSPGFDDPRRTMHSQAPPLLLTCSPYLLASHLLRTYSRVFSLAHAVARFSLPPHLLASHLLSRSRRSSGSSARSSEAACSACPSPSRRPGWSSAPLSCSVVRPPPSSRSSSSSAARGGQRRHLQPRSNPNPNPNPNPDPDPDPNP